MLETVVYRVGSSGILSWSVESILGSVSLAMVKVKVQECLVSGSVDTFKSDAVMEQNVFLSCLHGRGDLYLM